MPRLANVIAVVVFAASTAAPLALRAEPDGDTTVSFYRQVRPILQSRCQGCHQPSKAGGDLVLTSVAAMLRKGESELAGVVPGKPAESYLIEQITLDGGTASMPQDGEPLSPTEIALITQWIGEGAIDDTPASARQRYDALHPPRYTRPPVITSLDYAPDGSLIAVAGFHEVLLHRASPSAGPGSDGPASPPVARLIGMSERIASVRFSPDGTRLAVTGGSPARMGEVQIWKVATGELEISHPVTFDTVFGASWSPDGRRLAFGCGDNTVRAIDTETGAQVLFQSAHNDWVLDTVFSVDGSHLASVGRDATAKLIEVGTERFVDNITSITPGALRGGIHTVARHPLRDEILFGGADGIPKIYRMHRTTKRVIGDDANLMWQFPPLPGRVFGVDFSADGRVIAAGSSLDGQGTVRCYAMQSAPEVPDEVRAILVKPTHTRTPDEVARLEQHFADGIQVRATVTCEDGGIYAVAVSPDGSQVAAAGASGTVRILDSTSGDTLREFVPVELTIDETRQANAAVPPANISTSRQADGEAHDWRAEEGLPSAERIVGLQVSPESIELGSSTAYAQVVVTATLAGGEKIDATRLVHWQGAAPIVSVSPTGLIQGTSDGSATLRATLGEESTTMSVLVTGTQSPLQPDFVRDVAPILARTGCNAGTCHGAQDGKNGFKLSLRGYDPLFDVRALADDLASRRTDLAAPAQSLMLLKPTASVPHEGGQVIQPEGDYYRTLLSWIENGVPLNVDAPRVTRIEVTPVNPVVEQVGSRQQMRVVATYADGVQRDVTREAFIESGDLEIAQSMADYPGMIHVLRRGEAPILVRYEGAYAATTITVMGDRSGFVWEAAPVYNPIDEMVQAKLKRTKTAPSPLCDDYAFVRRIYLDLTGLPPTPEQIEAFQAAPGESRDKREELINRLVGSPEYVEHWSNKWADLLQVNSKFLGREGAVALRDWIRGEVQANRPYDEFARSVLTASGSTKENPAASYYKILREPEITMENTTQLFLATRFNCNKCHDHPFERWTQDQYYQMAAFFARIGFRKDPASDERMVGGTSVQPATPLYEVVFNRDEGETTHLRTGKVVEPAFPFDCDYECDSEASRRERLAAWITAPSNPYFAKSYANRIWAYLTGRGLIEPIDDIRAGNPPTNPELLDWLTAEFIESGFDVQHLMRLICSSATYQLALDTSQFNQDDEINYSHARARRLPAEVLYDSIYRATGARSQFPTVPQGTRAAALPDVGIELPDGFLNNLGRPARESACECERSSDLQMGPIMALINGATVGKAVGDPEGAVAHLASSESDDRQLVAKLFLRILGRPARDQELDDSLEVIRGIEAQHRRVVEAHAALEAELAPETARREQERLAALEAARAELAAHEQANASERERLAQQRTQKITAAQEALAAVRAALVEQQGLWETARQGETQWETVNPIEVSSTFYADLRVQPDRSVLVTGRNNAKSSNLVLAPVDLTSITGVRVEALADERHPRQGPGRAPDGNFVLTELKVSAAAEASRTAELLKVWDFAADAEGWQASGGTKLVSKPGRVVLQASDQPHQISSPARGPAEPLSLEVTARLTGETDLSVLWQTDSEPHFDQARMVKRRVSPGDASWRTYRIDFHPGAPLKKIKLLFGGGGTEIPLDSIRLVAAAPFVFEPVKLEQALADFSQEGFPVASAIDGKTDVDNNGWAIAPQMGRDHVAVFQTADSFVTAGDGLIRLELVHNYASEVHNLGRFRISVTRSSRPISLGLPTEIAALLAIAPGERTEPQQQQLQEFYLAQNESYVQQQGRLAEASLPLSPDPQSEQLKERITQLSEPLAVDPKLATLARAVELSQQQLSCKRLTAAQDLAWALINCPEFLYNH
jgi:WD40 repeat protein